MMALLLGRHLERDEEVHHKDFDRSHNCPGNLEVLANGVHQDLHQVLHPRSSKQVLVTCALPGCGQTKMVRASRATGDRYCGNEHRLEAMHQKAESTMLIIGLIVAMMPVGRNAHSLGIMAELG